MGQQALCIQSSLVDEPIARTMFEEERPMYCSSRSPAYLLEGHGMNAEHPLYDVCLLSACVSAHVDGCTLFLKGREAKGGSAGRKSHIIHPLPGAWTLKFCWDVAGEQAPNVLLFVLGENTWSIQGNSAPSELRCSDTSEVFWCGTCGTGLSICWCFSLSTFPNLHGDGDQEVQTSQKKIMWTFGFRILIRPHHLKAYRSGEVGLANGGSVKRVLIPAIMFFFRWIG